MVAEPWESVDAVDGQRDGARREPMAAVGELSGEGESHRNVGGSSCMVAMLCLLLPGPVVSGSYSSKQHSKLPVPYRMKIKRQTSPQDQGGGSSTDLNFLEVSRGGRNYASK